MMLRTQWFSLGLSASSSSGAGADSSPEDDPFSALVATLACDSPRSRAWRLTCGGRDGIHVRGKVILPTFHAIDCPEGHPDPVGQLLLGQSRRDSSLG